MDSLSFFKDKVSNILLQRGYAIDYPKFKEIPHSDPFGGLIRVDIEGKDKYASISFYSQGWLSLDSAEKDTEGKINDNTLKTILLEPKEITGKELALLALLDFLK